MMRDLLTGTTRSLKRAAPIVLAAAVLSLGADSGSAARSALLHGSRHTFRLVARPKSVLLTPGGKARVRIIIRRHRMRGRVRFRLITRLPTGVSARFTRVRTRGRRTTLILTASAEAVPGRYRLRIRGRSGRKRRRVTLTLIVGAPNSGQLGAGAAPPFSITGSTANPLMPGAPGPLDVVVSNPNALPLTIWGLTVTLQDITAPQASPVLPCGTSDFAVQQYSGPIPLTIPGSSARSLSELGIPAEQWPQVSLIDRPTNQDGCQGATLSLSYGAEARLG